MGTVAIRVGKNLKLPSKLRCELSKEGDMYVGVCLEFSISSCGRTPHEAIRKTDEALRVFLADIGELDQEGAEVAITPVPNYFWRAVRWEALRLIGIALRSKSPKVFYCKAEACLSAT